MLTWMSYDVVIARHQERLREAARSRLALAVQRARRESPTPAARLAGNLLTAVGAWLTATGRRWQADAPCYDGVAPAVAD